ncbi:wax ester/triacylglycerol synthase domain-containing protein [Tomitella biformata]|uniref:wax ester/triacylglycerol synthase domain-containing protein n=1 Tax=Tomitella biformata TaxID=630403 RepID=UPI000466B719|nr:wax ester/triacylglycerol synthase domain-containing protein [Tomitella biformata]
MQQNNLTQLAPRDAAFVYMERSTMPTNIVSIYAFDNGQGSGQPVRKDDVFSWMQARLHTSALFQRRLLRVPADIAPPYWVRDENVDLQAHIFVTESTITTWDEVRRRILDITEDRFDLTRPPWQLHVFTQVHQVDGLPPNATVVVLKFHHSACDGIASVEIARKLFTGQVDDTSDSHATSDAIPGSAALLKDALTGVPTQIRTMFSGAKDILAASRDVKQEVDAGTVVLPTRLRPRTRFDHKISGARTFGVVRLPLSDVRALASQAGDSTVNDLIMTVVSLGLSNYLTSLRELPAESLAALVPMSTRKYRPSESVNQFLPMFVDLHTKIEDPKLRLSAISKSSKLEKTRNSKDTVIRSNSGIKYVPGFAVRGISAISRLMPDGGPSTPYANTMITNVPRGRADLQFLGAKATSAFGVLALEDNDGLCHLIASLGDELTITFVSTPEAMPDVDHYGELLKDAYLELSDAIRTSGEST